MGGKVSKDGNQSRMISSSTNGLWMRVYNRGEKVCFLCNFCPMGCNGLLPKLEKILEIEGVSNYQEVDMAFIIAKRGNGVPVYNISEFLNSIKYIPIRMASEINNKGQSEEGQRQIL